MNRPRCCLRLPARPAAAFSVLELLVVVAILLVLTAMFWGFETKGTRNKKQRSCQANLQKLYVALDIFANDHTNALPFVPSAVTSEPALDLLIPKYTADLTAFICPASGDRALSASQPLAAHRISYAYYMGAKRGEATHPLVSDRQVNTAAKAIGQPVFSSDGKSPGNNHKRDGGNILFSDGHVEHSAAAASVTLTLPPGVILLNPKP